MGPNTPVYPTGICIFKNSDFHLCCKIETSQIRWLMYCKSAICKSGQFELDSLINWRPIDPI